MASNFLVRNLTPRMQRALPVIAAHYGMRSSNEVILAAIDAMIATVCEHEPIVALALREEPSNLPERVKVSA